MYLLDTDILSLVHAAHPRVLERRRTVPSSEIAVTIVTWVEILQGRFDSILKAADAAQLLRAQELLVRTGELLRELTVVSFDDAAAAELDRLRQNKKVARKIGLPDLMIASLALARRDTLVPRNLRDFQQIPGLRLENWAD